MTDPRALSCILTLMIVSSLLSIGLGNSALASRSLSYLWALGFGTVTGESMVANIGSVNLITTILIANAPQLLLSFLYLTYNGLFTCMLLANEWSNFGKTRKTLRVTTARGKQRSTYWLQLPYRYGIPLLATSAMLHWLVSQSLFLARVNVVGEDGQLDSTASISTCGYSNIAIIFVIALGSVTVLVGLAMGTRRYKAGMPLAGMCSAAISSGCHPPEGDTDAAFKGVMWGVVDNARGKQGVGHCSFTSFEVEPPVEGQVYA